MATKATSSRTGNGLSLLANKCAANTFDISSGMVYASMRDQIVRAQLVITDLHQSDPTRPKILIVGAGIAGVTAAACAANFGLEVVVLESKAIPFALQRGVTKRMVGPFMYEWPSLMSQSQGYPPVHGSLAKGLVNAPTWTASNPISADLLAKQLVPWYNTVRTSNPNLRFFYRMRSRSTKQYVQNFVAEHSKIRPAGALVPVPLLSLPDGTSFKPDYVILAVGMGTERVHLIDGTEKRKDCVKGKPFWGNDDFKRHPKMNWRVGVFGGGDGALQDVLRLITKFDHPLNFIGALQTNPNSIAQDLNAILPELDTLEQQSRLLHTWSGEIYQLIDSKCKQIAAQLALKAEVVLKVQTLLRRGNGKVIHVHRGQHFTKAYLLNRFCVHLIEQCLAQCTSTGTVGYERIKDEDAQSGFTTSSRQSIVLLSKGRRLILDRVAVRFGPNKTELEKRQIIKLSPEAKADRTSMAGIPLPYVVAQ